MKNTVKRFGLLFAVLIIGIILSVSAGALEKTGQCGDNVYWTFEESTGELTISGEGEMWDYNYYEENRPWEEFVDEIKTVIITDGVTTVGDSSFYYCNTALTGVIIPDSVVRIGNFAFYCCKNLNNITIPNSVTTIGSRAFSYCKGIETVVLSENITELGYAPFCGYTNIFVDENNQFFSTDEHNVLFNKEKTTLIQFPADSSVTKYDVPQSVTSIGSYAFNNSALEKLIIPDNVTSFGFEAFFYCENLKCLALPENITAITRGMFLHCKNLSKVYIPADVTNIYTYVFSDCESLKDVYYEGSKEQWEDIQIYSENESLSYATIHYNHRHSYTVDEILTSPSHFTEGEGVFVCVCGDSHIEVLEKIPHSFESETKEPDCDNIGYTVYSCSCGESYIADEKDAIGHNYVTTVIEPTCTEGGYSTHSCSNCGDTYTDNVLEALGHDERYYEEKAATCFENGWTEYVKCGRPNCGYTTYTAVPQLTHSFINYVYNNDATCTADGTKTAECVHGCGEKHTLTATDTVLNHIDGDNDFFCDTCNKEFERCEFCKDKDHENITQFFFCFLTYLIKIMTSVIGIN